MHFTFFPYFVRRILAVEVVDGDVCAFLGEEDGYGFADAAVWLSLCLIGARSELEES